MGQPVCDAFNQKMPRFANALEYCQSLGLSGASFINAATCFQLQPSDGKHDCEVYVTSFIRQPKKTRRFVHRAICSIRSALLVVDAAEISDRVSKVWAAGAKVTHVQTDRLELQLLGGFELFLSQVYESEVLQYEATPELLRLRHVVEQYQSLEKSVLGFCGPRCLMKRNP